MPAGRENPEDLISMVVKNDVPYNLGIMYRHPTVDDLDKMMSLETQWPKEIQATRDQILKRVTVFPQGAVVAVETHLVGREPKEGKIVGMITSQRLQAATSTQKVRRSSMSWDSSTNFGNITDHNDFGNALEPVGMIVDKDSQGKHIGKIMLLVLLKTAALLQPQINFVTVNIRLPGYHGWAAEFRKEYGKDPDPADYVRTHIGIDPVLRLHLSSLGGENQGIHHGQKADIASEGLGLRVDHSEMLSLMRRRLESGRHRAIEGETPEEKTAPEDDSEDKRRIGRRETTGRFAPATTSN